MSSGQSKKEKETSHLSESERWNEERPIKPENSPPPRPPVKLPAVPPPRKNPALRLLDGLSVDELKQAVLDQHEQIFELVNRDGASVSAKNGDGALPDLIDASIFLAEPIDAPPELIAGILHTGSKLILGGSSKSYKTWTLLDLGISVATGADWIGRATAQGKVLFVNFEIQPHAWQRRIVSVAEAKAVEIESGAIQLWNLRGHAADFKTLIPKIIERARHESFALIILDPIYKLYGNTDENSAGNVALLLNSLETLATETGAAIAFGAHFAKGNAAGKEAIDRLSGSGVFARDPDSILVFTKHEDDDAFVVEPILRNFAPVEPFAVRWSFPLMYRDDELDPARLKQARGRKREHTEEQLLEVLGNKSLTATAWQQIADKEHGIRRRTFYALKKVLEKSERIVKTKNNKWQCSKSK